MKKEKILIVDNDRVIVEQMAESLAGEGFDVEKAFEGAKALEILQEKHFDLVFLDYLMPRIRGDKICRFIKQSPKHKETKVLIVSDLISEGKFSITTLGADACIAKTSFPELKQNILAAITLLKNNDAGVGEIVLGKDHLYPRSSVRKLLCAQRHIEAILNGMTEGVLELDTDCTITYLNPAAETILGNKEWELLGKKYLDVFQFENKHEIARILESLLLRKDMLSKQVSMRCQDKHITFSFTSIVKEGELLGVAVIMNDITEKIQLEKDRCEKERLTGVMEMAGAAAHEINQPLAVISGYAQMLLLEAEKSEEKICRKARIIFDQVQRLGHLTKKIANIVFYKTKEYGKDTRIIDIDQASQHKDDDDTLKGMWE